MRLIYTLIVAGLLGSSTGVADPLTSSTLISSSKSPFMRVYGPVQPPYGYVRFCEAKPEECAAAGGEDRRFKPSPARLSQLDEINRKINRAIQPATDEEIYGMSEHWTIPGRRGDCEDYALLKRKVLMQRGWPASALLLTVVRDEKGDGHAVLTARTAHGDFLLDNKFDDVRLWNASGYTYVMRQSYLNPRVWVSLDPAQTSPGSLAGVRD
ncbi:MAG: transglutaminase-like cysteine peptidase [Alphaproteobacteria bacterium]|nr:transglutaminase-like cysteine peptidase [Alphaproteobacteria bacterium]